MRARAHVFWTAIAAGVAIAPGGITPEGAGAAAAAALASTLPDLDSKGSPLYRLLGPLRWAIGGAVQDRLGGHRGPLHSLIAAPIVAGLVVIVAGMAQWGLPTFLPSFLPIILGGLSPDSPVPGLVGEVLSRLSHWPVEKLMVPVAWGYGAHLAEDLLDPWGVPLLWPLPGFRERRFRLGKWPFVFIPDWDPATDPSRQAVPDATTSPVEVSGTTVLASPTMVVPLGWPGRPCCTHPDCAWVRLRAGQTDQATPATPAAPRSVTTGRQSPEIPQPATAENRLPEVELTPNGIRLIRPARAVQPSRPVRSGPSGQPGRSVQSGQPHRAGQARQPSRS